MKTGNLDCTFCLDCVVACPYDNVTLATRVPASELWSDARRSGVGLLSKRRDLGALALVFTFGALLNAFSMVSPVYTVETWLADAWGTTREAPVLGAIFLGFLVVAPLLLVGFATWLTRRLANAPGSLLDVALRFSYALVPLGLGVWVAHYAFHLLTGLWTFVPALQAGFVDLGPAWFGTPDWTQGGLPTSVVHPLQVGFLALGLVGSLLVAYRIAARDHVSRTKRAFAPWAALSLLLWGSAMWLLAQPMEMRGTSLGG
jgi:hypothetical protein